jgi:hypothetical protein
MDPARLQLALTGDPGAAISTVVWQRVIDPGQR